MKDIHFNALDLNLLRVFAALYEERSVTRAGARLGLSQSAVSHALNRLRSIIDDELFQRGPGGMSPTARAAQIWPDLKTGLTRLQEALAPSDFDPAETDRAFDIAAPPPVSFGLLPEVVARVRREAPHAQLRIRGLGPDAAAAVESGAVDVALASFGRMPERFSREILLEDRMVWVMSSDNPAAGQPLTLDRLAEMPLLVLAVGQGERGGAREGGRILVDDSGAWERALGGRAARRHIQATSDDLHAAAAIIAGSDLVGMMPSRMAHYWATLRRLKVFDPPYESGRVTLEMLWREEASGDPGLQWLLGLIRDAVRTSWVMGGTAPAPSGGRSSSWTNQDAGASD